MKPARVLTSPRFNSPSSTTGSSPIYQTARLSSSSYPPLPSTPSRPWPRQLNTITIQLGNIQAVVATLPTFPTLEEALSQINASLRDQSQRVSAAPPSQAPASTWPSIPPCGTAIRPNPLPAQTKTKFRVPPPSKASSSSFNGDISRYNTDTRAFYGKPQAYAAKLPDSWEANAFREGKYPDPCTFISGRLAPDCPKPQPSYA